MLFQNVVKIRGHRLAGLKRNVHLESQNAGIKDLVNGVMFSFI